MGLRSLGDNFDVREIEESKETQKVKFNFEKIKGTTESILQEHNEFPLVLSLGHMKEMTSSYKETTLVFDNDPNNLPTHLGNSYYESGTGIPVARVNLAVCKHNYDLLNGYISCTFPEFVDAILAQEISHVTRNTSEYESELASMQVIGIDYLKFRLMNYMSLGGKSQTPGYQEFFDRYSAVIELALCNGINTDLKRLKYETLLGSKDIGNIVQGLKDVFTEDDLSVMLSAFQSL